MPKEILRLHTTGEEGRVLLPGTITFVGRGRNAIEPHARMPIAEGGIISRLHMRVTNPPGVTGGGGQPLTAQWVKVKLYKSGEPTLMELTIQGDESEKVTEANPVPVLQNETLSVKVELSAEAQATGITGYLTVV